MECGNRRPGAIALVAYALAMTFFWLVVLPRMADRPAAREANARFDAAGVDPGALFYTDHPRLSSRWWEDHAGVR